MGRKWTEGPRGVGDVENDDISEMMGMIRKKSTL